MAGFGIRGSGFAKSPRRGKALAVATLAAFCLLPTAFCFGQAQYRHDGRALLPDSKYTPGAVIKGENPCSASFRTSKVRNVPESLKKRVYAEYGAVEKKGICCEVDHLISLELGGSNDIKNLWPQPYSPAPGAHQKDVLENYLHRQVCEGKLGLGEAQKEISTDWYRVYEKLGK